MKKKIIHDEKDEEASYKYFLFVCLSYLTFRKIAGIEKRRQEFQQNLKNSKHLK